MKLVFALVLAAGCALDPGADGPTGGYYPTFDQACAPAACESGPVATAAAHVEAVIESAGEWTGFGEYTTGCLGASKNIPVQGTLTIRGADIAVPARCGDGCRQAVKFRMRDAIEGVECVGPNYWWDFVECDDVSVHDTTIRVRTVLQDVHPGLENWIPVVELLASCGNECTTAFSCEATHTCWESARDYCAYCLGGDNEACACWTGTSFASEGSACTYMVSGDVQLGGTCQAGTCVSEPW